ncbi:MAG: peptidase [Alphaproteobacteria bacterium]|nr:peptidase [Alphaproteobacteria bacterium]
MTYCLGMLLDEGMVFMSDTRTNAGIDHVSTFTKMRIFEKPGERILVLLSTGNLATTQAVNDLLEEQIGAGDGKTPSLMNVTTLFRAARLVAEAQRSVYRIDAGALKEAGIDGSATFIFGGQIAGEKPRLFLIYAAGNFIEANEDTVFFQAGELKYGKPVLDRVVRPGTSLLEATKCAMVSFDSTMKSNVSVAPPLDLAIIRRDGLRVALRQRIQETDPYFLEVRKRWGEGLRSLFGSLPEMPWRIGG